MKRNLQAILVIMVITFATQTVKAQYVGINNSSPDDPLDVVGSAQITGPLKVGNPTAPPSQALTNVKLLDINPSNGFGGTGESVICGGSRWQSVRSTTNKNYFVYDNTGTYNMSRFLTSWIWVPKNSTNHYLNFLWDGSLESGFDGVYLEVTSDGVTYSKVTTFTGGAYAACGGSNGACNGNSNITSWTGTQSNQSCQVTTFPITLAGKWIRFSFTGQEDVNNATGDWRLYGLSFDCSAPSNLLNATFQNGSVYAEKNVYAGSNVMMGDLAEYFRVVGKADPGMLVSMSVNGKDQYELTKTKNDTKVIGIVSTSPTVTLNTPNGGIPIAMAGRVPVCVTDENGSISTGDYLTASSTPGYAMKAVGSCFVIGKAVESFTGNSGKITCVVENGWMNTGSSEEIISGDFYIAKGKNTATIKNPLVSKNSKLSVTPLTENSNFFVTKNSGSFKMTIDKIATKNMYFDYFAINPSGTKKAYEDKVADTKDIKEIKFTPLPQVTQESLQVPPTPADPTKFYKWDGKTVTEFIPSVSSKTNTQ